MPRDIVRSPFHQCDRWPTVLENVWLLIKHRRYKPANIKLWGEKWTATPKMRNCSIYSHPPFQTNKKWFLRNKVDIFQTDGYNIKPQDCYMIQNWGYNNTFWNGIQSEENMQHPVSWWQSCGRLSSQSTYSHFCSMSDITLKQCDLLLLNIHKYNTWYKSLLVL